MDAITLTRYLAFIGLALGVIGILLRLREIMNRPFKKDYSRPRGSAARGVLYAFTLGMAPWEKESTRLHWVAYLRGIFFHLGIFTAFAVVLFAPRIETIPAAILWLAMALTLAGAVFGFAGIYIRLTGKNERALSLPDDYFSVFLTSLFSALAFGALLTPTVLPYLYVVTALMSIYIPFSKIRHCVYFFYSKFFFGYSFGHRGVIGPDNQKVVR
ncbi:MAG: hypothetical protein QME21_16225 [Anaerolineales bacterium]|nr:hypothetical protein [Anaerolineales bacterium]